jgi:hypothetical protein
MPDQQRLTKVRSGKRVLLMRTEGREDCVAFLCECGDCVLPVAMLRRGQNAGLRIESNHHGQKHTNILTTDDLAWANLYLSSLKGGTILERLSLETAQPASRDVEVLRP